MRLLETDLLDIVEACVDKKLSDLNIIWKKGAAATVVLASGGYPNAYEKGKIISGIAEAEQQKDVVVFQAGTTMKDGALVTNGGRVLGVSAVGETLDQALTKAYEAIEKISFEGMYFRKDIGIEYR
jgi:phosphoribosylamine--glycine ligase